jgi:hypothetical protein
MDRVKELAAAEPPIDPARMPSEGLIRAAQYTYPFNHFDLTPWVDPRAHDLLEPPPAPLQLVLPTRALFQRGQVTLDVVPQVVEFRGNVVLETTLGDDQATVTADQLTVDFTPAPETQAQGVWVMAGDLAAGTAAPPAPSPRLLHRWMRAIYGQKPEAASGVTGKPGDAPQQDTAPTPPPSDPPLQPLPPAAVPEPAPKP